MTRGRAAESIGDGLIGGVLFVLVRRRGPIHEQEFAAEQAASLRSMGDGGSGLDDGGKVGEHLDPNPVRGAARVVRSSQRRDPPRRPPLHGGFWRRGGSDRLGAMFRAPRSPSRSTGRPF